MAKYFIEYLEDDYPEDFNNASEKSFPDPSKFPKYKKNDVIDEEQSVRWNREEISRRMQAYQDEVNRLEEIRKERMHKVNQDVIDSIALEFVSHKIVPDKEKAYKKAEQLFIYANTVRNEENEDREYMAKLIRRLVRFAEQWEDYEQLEVYSE